MEVYNIFREFFEILKVGTHEGTSPCKKSRGQVQPCELAIMASKSSCRDQKFSPRD